MFKIVAIGNPNSGKSAVLNRLTGSRIMVSNYPGTSLEITRITDMFGHHEAELFDTPGVYSLASAGEAVQVLDLIEKEQPDLILNVVDASNLNRNLVLTYELLALEIPMIVVLNQIDAFRKQGYHLDIDKLKTRLGCPVIPFSAVTGEGVLELGGAIESFIHGRPIASPGKRNIIIPVSMAASDCSGNCFKCQQHRTECINEADQLRAEEARQTAEAVLQKIGNKRRSQLDSMQKFIDHSFGGIIFLLVLVYLAFYALLQFISLSEGPINELLMPVSNMLQTFLQQILPPGRLTRILSLAVPEGLIIPFTIIMPAMLYVSFLMSVLEDTGLLPRYSVALERVGSFLGISGQGIIPLALGFGCRTPAIMATRIIPDTYQRFLVVTLLSIVIPCSATLGVLSAVIATFNASLGIILVTMLSVFLILSLLLSRKVEQAEFIYELPPLRVPTAHNVWLKSRSRLAGFFTEVLPLLLVMNIGMRILIDSGALEYFRGLESLSRGMFGIPAEALVAVLITVFQRYLAPLVLLNIAMTPREATVAIAMIALSLPCLPSMVMTIRELGYKALLKILAMGLLTSFAVGISLNIILPAAL